MAVTSGLPTPGIDDWELLAYLEISRQMHAPVYPGDRIHQTFVVERLRPSTSRPGSGVVMLSAKVTNDQGDLVQSGTDSLLIGAREGGA
jgi:acyl dehydratase